jgi:hypothetical protein
MESGVGSLISFSTQPGNVALDGVGRNSPFAGALVEELSISQEDLSTILIDVRNKVIAETGSRQVPWEHSALRARFYVHETPQGGAAAASSTPLQLSEAAQTWSVTKGTTSESVLRAFIVRFPGTVFAELAGARLKELSPPPVQSEDRKVCPLLQRTAVRIFEKEPPRGVGALGYNEKA